MPMIDADGCLLNVSVDGRDDAMRGGTSGQVRTRKHLDERTRRFLVIGTMIALGQWDEFRLHVRAALVEGGFTPGDIKEIILQQAIYCGVPVANHAVKEASTIVAELGTFEELSSRATTLKAR